MAVPRCPLFIEYAVEHYTIVTIVTTAYKVTVQKEFCVTYEPFNNAPY